MPVAAGVGIATAIAGGISAFTQHDSADKASTLKARADADALALARQQEATRKEEYDKNLELQKQQWDAQQTIRAPYRAAGANALHKLGDILGVDFGSGVTGPTPSTPGTFGTSAPSSFATSPDRTAQRNATQQTFDAGTDTITRQLNGLAPGMVRPPMPAPSTSPTDPAAIQDQVAENFARLNVKPTAADLATYTQQIRATGGLTAENLALWFGPQGRIATDLLRARSGAPPTPRALAPPVALAPPAAGGIAPGYTPIIPISGLLPGRGPYP